MKRVILTGVLFVAVVLLAGFSTAAKNSEIAELKNRIENLELKEKLANSIFASQEKQIEELQRKVDALNSQARSQIPPEYAIMQIQQLQRQVDYLQDKLRH